MSGSLPDPVPPAAVRREASLPMEAAAGRFMKQNAGHPGCVIVGELTDDEQRHGESILKLAHALGWPVLADALSGLSLRDSPNVVCHAPLIVSQDNVPEPVAALRFGGPLVAKELIRFEAAIESGRRLCVHRAGRRFDPLLTRPAVLCGSPSEFCRAALPAIQRRSDAGWSEEWRARSDSTKENVARILDGGNDGDVPTEPGIARTIARLMPAESVLFIGNSMPVRDFDRHASIPHRQKQPLIAGNRGTSGIDGNFATIAGHARGSRLPTAAILGDLAALHDLNSLPLLVAAAGELPFLPIVVVIVNNGGGGIFRILPALAGIPERQRLIETPHALRLGSAATMFGIRHTTPDTIKAFGDTFRAAIERPGVTLIEIISDIEANARLQARLSGHS